MRTQTTIYSAEKRTQITTIDGPLMPPVGAKFIVNGRHYTVTEPPEIYISPADDQRDNEVSVYITVEEG